MIRYFLWTRQSEAKNAFGKMELFAWKDVGNNLVFPVARIRRHYTVSFCGCCVWLARDRAYLRIMLLCWIYVKCMFSKEWSMVCQEATRSMAFCSHGRFLTDQSIDCKLCLRKSPFFWNVRTKTFVLVSHGVTESSVCRRKNARILWIEFNRADIVKRWPTWLLWYKHYVI